MEYQILALKKGNWYFKYQLVLRIPIGTSNTNWDFKYQLVLQIPIGTSNTNWYLKYQLVLQIPIGTSNTIWYLKYKSVLQIPIVTIHQEQHEQQQSRASTTCSRPKNVNKKFSVLFNFVFFSAGTNVCNN
jgi:hypothetical protein